jgi:Tol biopolymer transport system component
MRTKTLITILLIVTLLAACAPTGTPVPPTVTPTTVPTSTLTLTPISSPTATATLTPTPNPKPATQLIAFSSNEQGNWDVYRINLDGTGKTQLTFTANDERLPAWSPDGSKLLYQIQQGDSWQIMMMNWDGSNPIQLTNEGSNQYASWSPDGIHILFDSDRNGNRDIFQMELDGTNQTALTNHPANELFPVWSPDGSMIAYLSEQDMTAEECTMNWFDGCPQEIFIMDSTGNFLRKIPDLNQLIGRVVWSPDSQLFAILEYSDNGSGLVFYDLQSQTIKYDPGFSTLLNSIYQTGRSTKDNPRSFSFSPKGYNGIVCMMQDFRNQTGQLISGCYMVDMEGKMLFTLFRKESPIYSNEDTQKAWDYADAVWQS